MPQPDRWQLKRRIPSQGEEAQRFIDQVSEQLEAYEWPNREIFQVRMAVEEAVTNAIEHGNRRDPRKTVQLDCAVDAQSFYLEVTDEGEGFCRQDVPDCTDCERREMERGRGLMLMENFMSSVEYLGRGNRIRLTRMRDDAKFLQSR